ncbi:hypothetical protein Aph01nite_68200 [Acrocarpospora phusangensis]|uniref:Uncharacterized protein n=1 Tax=Acrocarpospora phusangensis TaxID=1070424 RepID=A0A919QLJ7_9ACTN|nr:hypothetical protein [Acrocarpospora phusangensis]GIH28510.1 hypothetical protein Aph01nite_68200 [Acrocarpospora phusangensis]
MLVVAVLAPAVLAIGLLVAELTDYGVKGRGAFSIVLERQDDPQMMGPVLVPAPARPDRVYEGTVPAPRRATSDVGPMPLQAAPARQEVPRPARTASPAVQAECPDDWADTWLWELCQEDARQPA